MSNFCRKKRKKEKKAFAPFAIFPGLHASTLSRLYILLIPIWLTYFLTHFLKVNIWTITSKNPNILTKTGKNGNAFRDNLLKLLLYIKG